MIIIILGWTELTTFLYIEHMKNENPAGMTREVMFDLDEVSVPTVSRLKAELSHAQQIIAKTTEKFLNNEVRFSDAGAATARLMMASAFAASAIAKIVDAETRQVLAAERIRAGYFPPRYRPDRPSREGR
jgi:hypothetical protein